MSDKQTITTTWQQKRASFPRPVLKALEAWQSSEGRVDTERMELAVEAYEDAEEICRQCDEPGCNNEGTSGWNHKDGDYRRTCHKHWEEYKNDTAT